MSVFERGTGRLENECRDTGCQRDELKATIAELRQLADPLTKALYKEMSERHTAICLENKALRDMLKRYRKETPLGHQPHMITEEVDKLLEKNDE